jgi:basic membrane protein A and related proteins
MDVKRIGILLIFVFLALLAMTACGTRTTSPSGGPGVPKRIVLLFDSPVADDSFSLACLRGAEKAKNEYGITLTICEAGTDSEAASLMLQLAESKRYDLIIGMGGSQTAALEEAAKKYASQKFASVDGDTADMSNVSSLLTRDNESSYLAGALAAMISKTNIIGFVGGREQPSIQRFLAGYRAGAQYIKADCKVLEAYAGSWLNDGKTKSLAQQQIAEGADVVYGPAGAGSLGVIEAAREKGLYAVGVDADQSPLAPETVIISAVKHIDVPVYETIRSLVQNRFSTGIQSSGLKEGAVEGKINTTIMAITPVMQTKIGELEKKVISGEIRVPEN